MVVRTVSLCANPHGPVPSGLPHFALFSGNWLSSISSFAIRSRIIVAALSIALRILPSTHFSHSGRCPSAAVACSRQIAKAVSETIGR